MRVALRQSSSSGNALCIGNLRLDPATAMVSKDGEEIVLSALEYRLLLYFLQNQGRLITREMLRDAIWNTAGEYVSDNSINVYIRRLRERIEDDPAHPEVIVTARGLGYRIGAGK